MAVANHTAQIKKLLKPAIKPLLREWDAQFPQLSLDSRAFEGFTNSQMRNIASTRFFNRLDHRRIPGWLTPKERQVLYALGRWIPGPIAEIGPWAGLSTTAIAYGIKGSGESKEFHTIDLNPSDDWFRPCDGGIGFFPPGVEVPFGICDIGAYQKGIKPIVSLPGGPVGLLKKHLAERHLSSMVAVHVGHFINLPKRPWRFVFCDALHDEAEIKTNGPALLPLLSSGCILACHDVGRSRDDTATLCSIIPFRHFTTVDSLLIGEIE